MAVNYSLFAKMLHRQLKITLATRASDQVTLMLEKRKQGASEFGVADHDGVSLDAVLEGLCASINLNLRFSFWQIFQMSQEFQDSNDDRNEKKKKLVNNYIKNCQRDLESLKRAVNKTGEKADRAKVTPPFFSFPCHLIPLQFSAFFSFSCLCLKES